MSPGAHANLDCGSPPTSSDKAQRNRASEPTPRIKACPDKINPLQRVLASPARELRVMIADNGRLTMAMWSISLTLSGSAEWATASAPPWATRTKPATAAFPISSAMMGTLSIAATALASVWLRSGTAIEISGGGLLTQPKQAEVLPAAGPVTKSPKRAPFSDCRRRRKENQSLNPAVGRGLHFCKMQPPGTQRSARLFAATGALHHSAAD